MRSPLRHLGGAFGREWRCSGASSLSGQGAPELLESRRHGSAGSLVSARGNKEYSETAATRERRAAVENDACSTVSVSCGRQRKHGGGGVVFRSGAAVQNPYIDRQKTQNGTYGGRFSLPKKKNIRLLLHSYNAATTQGRDTSSLVKTSRSQLLRFRPRRRGSRGFAPKFLGTHPGFRSAKIRFVRLCHSISSLSLLKLMFTGELAISVALFILKR